ncbi:helix-turn-helix domain-containing protein [Glutamicibacter sp. AOP5-A2-18]|uniref:helix-turn-helix domain-containing protein n=1 Tax=Glutamicibacter sp. AOP5-A2-18 TaxID=3457656 RepID=UPI004034D502
MDTTEFLSRSEAAEYLGLSPQTLANNRHTGPAYHKLFGAVRYSKTDLESWARQQRVTPSRSPERRNGLHLLRAPASKRAA